MLLFNYATLLYIGIEDLRRHRIPNVALLILFLANLSTAVVTRFSIAAFAFLLLTAFAYITGLGMGDVKLISLLVLITTCNLNRFALAQILGIAMWAGIFLLLKGSIQGQIPLAPGIFIAYLMM